MRFLAAGFLFFLAFPGGVVAAEARIYRPALVSDGLKAEVGQASEFLVITTQPAGVSLSARATMSLSLVASGLEPISFQWYKDGLPVAGAKAALFSKTNALPVDSGEYFVILSNSAASLTSSVARVVVEWKTELTSQGAGDMTSFPGRAVGPAAADFDGDGSLDLFLTTHSPEYSGTLFRNNGQGVFSKVNNIVSQNPWNGQQAVWGDMNNDAKPDLLVAMQNRAVADRNLLYLNLGGGNFEVLPGTSLPSFESDSIGVAWADLDNDGWLDLAVASGGRAQIGLYRNDANFTFEDFTHVGNISNGGGVSILFVDLNDDGLLDAVTAGTGAKVFKGLGNFRFTEIAAPGWPPDAQNFTVQSGDYDNDGRMDLLLYYWDKGPKLFRNLGGFLFAPADEPRLNIPATQQTVTWGDLNQDGFLDLAPGALVADFSNDGIPDVVNPGSPPVFYKNRGSGANWLTIRLRGRPSNSMGIGAKISVRATVDGRLLTQTRQAQAGNGYSNPGFPEHYFGLGDATVASEVVVDWPSGMRSVRYDVAANQVLMIDEAPEGYPVIRLNNQFKESGAHEFRSSNPAAVSIFSDYPRIYFTTNGEPPFDNEQLRYIEPFFVGPGVTVRAIAYNDDFDESPETSAMFTVTPKFKLSDITPGGGSISFDPPSPDGMYFRGDQVTLTPSPQAGWQFELFREGDLLNSAAPLKIEMDRDRSIAAVFSTPIDIVEGSGQEFRNPFTATYSYDSDVTVWVVPAANRYFSQWTRPDSSVFSTNNPLTLRVKEAGLSLRANYLPLVSPNRTLTVGIRGPGTVERSLWAPFYANGSQVFLTAQPAQGYEFVGWSEDVVSTEPVLAVTMNTNKHLVATFDRFPPRIVSQPRALRVAENGNFKISIEIGGTPGNTSFVWKRNGEILRDFTTQELYYRRTPRDFGGSFQLFVTNEIGSTVSEPIEIDVVPIGEELARIPLPGASRIALDLDRSVYFSTSNKVVSLNRDFSPRWEALGQFATAPVIGSDGTVYVGGKGAHLYAFKPETGVEKWRFETQVEISAPAIGGNGDIYFAQGASFLCVRSDGTLKWQWAERPGSFYGDITIGLDGTIYCPWSGFGRGLLALSPDGVEQWTYPQATLGAPGIAKDGNILVSEQWFAGQKYFASIYRQSGANQWQRPLFSSASPAVAADGTIYLAHDEGTFHSIDPATGEDKWTRALSTFNSGPVVAADGSVAVLAGQGESASLVIFEPDGRERRRIHNPEFASSRAFFLSDDRLYYVQGATNLIIYVGDATLADSSWPMWKKTAGYHGNAQGIPGDLKWLHQSSGNIFDTMAEGDDGTILASLEGGIYQFHSGADFIRQENFAGTPVAGPDRKVYTLFPINYQEYLSRFVVHDLTKTQRVAEAVVPGLVYSFSTVALAGDGTAFFCTWEGRPNTGRVFSWNNVSGLRELQTFDGAIRTPPAIQDTNHILVSAGRTLYRLTRGGDVANQFQPPSEFSSWPFVGEPVVGGDGTVYVMDEAASLYALSPDLSPKWSRSDLGWGALAGPVIGPDGTLYCTLAGPGTTGGSLLLHAIAPGGQSKWNVPVELPEGQATYSTAAVGQDKTVYLSGLRRFFAVRDTGLAGQIAWSRRLDEQLEASPLLVGNGRVYFPIHGGDVFSLQASSGPADSPWPMYRRDGRRTGNSVPVNAPPRISITQPAANAVFFDPAIVTFLVDAADSDGQVVKVELLSGDTVLETVTTSPFEMQRTFEVGAHTVRTRATDNQGAASFSAPVSFEVKASKPSIVKPPQGGLVAAGAEIFLNVEATGTAPLHYEWFFNDARLEGKTAPELSIPNAQASHSGRYKVRIFNAGGETASREVLVTVGALSVLRQDFWAPNGPVNAIAVAPDRIFIGGAFSELSAQTGRGALLDAASGFPDPAIARVGDADISAVVSDGLGGWFIGGGFTSVGGVPRNGLAHIRADGSLDSNWTASASGGRVEALAISGNRLYVGGSFSHLNGALRTRLGALTTSGSLETWTSSANATVSSILVAGDYLYVGGAFITVGGKGRTNLARIHVETAAVSDDWAPEPNGQINALAVSGTRLVASGASGVSAFSTGSGAALIWKTATDSSVLALAVSGNSVVVGGRFTAIGNVQQGRLARLRLDTGAVDTTWRPSAGVVWTLALGVDRLYAGGEFLDVNNESRLRAAAFSFDGTLLPWAPQFDGTVRTLAVHGNKVFAGGAFNTAGIRRNASLAALDPVSGQVQPWRSPVASEVHALALANQNLWVASSNLLVIDPLNPDQIRAQLNTDGPVYALAVAGNIAYFGGAFSVVNNQPRKNIAAYDFGAGQLLSWGQGIDVQGAVRSLRLHGSLVYAGGSFKYGNANNLIALNIGGTVEPWAPNPNNTVFALSAFNNDVFAGGSFSVIGANAQLSEILAAIDSNTGAKTVWPSAAQGLQVKAFSLAGNRLLVGGSFSQVAGTARANLAGLDLNSSGAHRIAPEFNPAVDGEVRALAQHGRQVYVGGNFARIDGQPAPNFAILGPSGPPVILQQPEDVETVVGGGATLQVAAVGQEPLFYQWTFGGEAIPGATNAQLSFASARISNARAYRAVISNKFGSTTSSEAKLTVVDARAPVILGGSTNFVVNPGERLELFHEVTGAGPIRFRWLRNGTVISTEQKLILTDVQLAHAGVYTLIAANDYATVTGPDHRIEVNTVAGELRDAFASAGIVRDVAGVLRGDSRTAGIEANEPKLFEKTRAGSMWAVWLPPSNGMAEISSAGSDFDTILAVFEAPQNATSFSQLSMVAADDDSGGFLTSKVQFNVDGGTAYFILVAGFGEASGDILISYKLTPGPRNMPRIKDEPYGRTVNLGDPATLNVQAELRGDGALSYQWYRNGTRLDGKNSASLFIPSVTLNDIGIYVVGVSNSIGQGLLSQPVAIEINDREGRGADFTVASKDKVGDALRLLVEGAFSGKKKVGRQFGGAPARGYSGYQAFNTMTLGKQIGEPIHCNVPGVASAWYLIRAEATGTMKVTTAGSDFDTVLAIYLGEENAISFNFLTPYECDLDSGPNKTSVKEFPVTAGEVYHIAVDGQNGGRGNVQLSYGLKPVFTAHPAGQLAALGQAIQLSVSVSGQNSIRWLKNGVVMEGKTGQTLSIPAFTVADAGVYSVLVENHAWQLISEGALIMPPAGLLSGNNFIYSLQVRPGEPLVIERSVDLEAWDPIATNIPTTIFFQWSAPIEIDAPRYFYRSAQ